MASLDLLVDAAKTYIANPYADEGAYRSARTQLRTARGEILGCVDKLIDGDRESDARRVLVALATLTKLDADPKSSGRVLVPDATLRDVEITGDALASIAAAAARVDRQLRRFVGDSLAAREVRKTTWAATFGKSLYDAWKQRASIRQLNVLILGETGTGKEIVARTIQVGVISEDPNEDPPMADINAAAIARELFENELFGHVKGGYTGAISERQGLFERASGGTLFLDEVADMDPAHQPRLLRVLQERRVARVGGSEDQHEVDVRIVAATSRPIEKLVRAERFREDLYQRLRGCEIRIPPLRERREDVDLIARSVADGQATGPSMVDDPNLLSFLAHLKDYSWPGNGRELERMVRAHVLSMPGPNPSEETSRSDPDDAFIEQVRRCELNEKRLVDGYMRRILQAENNVRAAAAKRLGIDRDTLANRLKREDRDE